MSRKHMKRILSGTGQAVAVAVAWVVFGAAWVKVAHETTEQLALFTISVIAVGLVAVITATSFWIRHNVNIYKKKGPRRGLREVTFEEGADFVGRRLVADWDEAQAAKVVRVRLKGDEKIFVAEGAQAPHETARAS